MLIGILFIISYAHETTLRDVYTCRHNDFYGDNIKMKQVGLAILLLIFSLTVLRSNVLFLSAAVQEMVSFECRICIMYVDVDKT